MNKEEIAKKGYTYIGVLPKSPVKKSRKNYLAGLIIVWKDGFYGVLSPKTGEELSPCVHLSKDDAIDDVKIILADKENWTRDIIGIQKILQEYMDKEYDPYIGSVVRMLLDLLALPEGIYFEGANWSLPLHKDQFRKVTICICELIRKMIKIGDIKFQLVSDNPAFKKFCNDLSKLVGDNTIIIKSALEKEIEIRRFKLDDYDVVSQKEKDILKDLVTIKPMITITASKTVYSPDINAGKRVETEFIADAYKKSVALELLDKPKKI